MLDLVSLPRSRGWQSRPLGRLIQVKETFTRRRVERVQSELIGKALRVGCALPSSTGFFEQAALPIARMPRVHTAIVERFGRRADGELVPLTTGSTEPVVEVRQHAGIAMVERWEFSLTSPQVPRAF